MNIRNILLGISLIVVASAANAATVFIPTDGNINFADQTGNFDLAIFDSLTNLQSNPASRLDVSLGDKVGHDNPVTQLTNITAGSSPFNVTDGNFIIGGYDGSNWVGGIGTQYGDTVYKLTFNGITGGALVVDIQVVPIPSAIWLFGAGLLGLVGVARRRA